MTKQTENEKSSHKCPYCKEAIKVAAIKCKYCDSTMPSKPRHEGTCPFCAESIDIEATKCKHCKSTLLPFITTHGMVSSDSTEKKLSGSSPIWETPFGNGTQSEPGGCTVRTYCNNGIMYSDKCCYVCRWNQCWTQCTSEIVGTCSEGGKYEMGGYRT